MTEPCDLTAVAALQEFASKSLSPLELYESCVARIEAVNPTVNAVVASDIDQGLATARRMTEALGKGEDLGVLGGLPVGIKDLEATAGLRTTWGSLEFEHHVPDADDKLVADIRQHGGNVFCKTNTPEFGAGGNTVNKVYGATCNPFDTEKTCAGSSGGTAVALSTGMMPIATGSDYGGSLRTPAAFCGIAGFRPSPGVVPNVHSGVALSPFPVLGPMGRCVADIHLQLRATTDADRRDPYSSVSTFNDQLNLAPLDELRLGWSVDMGCCPVDLQIAEIFKSRIGGIASQFSTSDERTPKTDNVHEVFEVLRGVVFAAAHEERVRNHADILGPNVIDNTERGLSFTASDIARAFAQQTVLYRDMLQFFEDVDVVITPAAAVSPFPHRELAVTEINGETMPTYMRWLALAYVPTTTLCCSCVIPCGTDHLGMPFGIQVIGPNGSDNKVLAVAAAVESVLQSDAQTARPLPDLGALSAG